MMVTYVRASSQRARAVLYLRRNIAAPQAQIKYESVGSAVGSGIG
jgi:hypothetical protein